MVWPVIRPSRLLPAGAAVALLTACPGETLSSGVSRGSATTDPVAAAPVELPVVLVPAGPFVMGSEGSRRGGMDRELPRAQRELAAFEIDRTEVTNQAYARFLSSEAARTHAGCHPDEPRRKDHTPAQATAQERVWGAVADPFGDPARAEHPVVGVDWYDAFAFAAWAGRRLPNEDEWEKAARGADGRTFPWGEQPPTPNLATYRSGDAASMTTPVGAHPDGASPCGALDMAGNAWEWTASPLLAYRGAPEGAPSRPDEMVIRGGGWTSSGAFYLRAAMRDPRPRLFRSAVVGFRTVSGAPSAGPAAEEAR